MKVEFYDIDRSKLLYATEKNEIESFVNCIKSVDRIHLQLTEDNICHGRLVEIVQVFMEATDL